MYLVSWVSFEALIVTAKVSKLDKSDAAWSAERENAPKRDDPAIQSSNETTARLPQGTVVMSSIAATSGQQPDGGSKRRTTVGSPMPDEHLLKFRLLSTFRGAMGLLCHITTWVFLMQDTRALINVSKGAFGKDLSSLAVIPVSANDLSLPLSHPMRIDKVLVFPFLIMPILAIIRLLLSVVLASYGANRKVGRG